MSFITFQSKTLDSPRIAHAFFGRDGGVSEGMYAGLNCGVGSNDNADHVQENRRRVAENLGTTPDRLCTLYQIHSAEVVNITEPTQGQIRADAMVTTLPNLLLGILTADCVPVLFADEDAGVIGAAHAGWRGAVGGVLENTLQAMLKLGARKSRIAACIGPAIGQASYEVGPEVIEAILRKDPEARQFLKPTTKRTFGLFDIQGFVNRQLHGAGLRDVTQVSMDTYSNAAQFFSFRRTTHRGELDYGRQISCIMLRERRSPGATPYAGPERRAR